MGLRRKKKREDEGKMLCGYCADIEREKKRSTKGTCVSCGKIVNVNEGEREICEKCSSRFGVCQVCGESFPKNRSKRRMK